LVVFRAAVTATVLTKTVGPGGRGENPSSGADQSARLRQEGGVALGRALEALFDSCPGNDVIAIAEAEFRLQRALLVPQVV
jgi:hypothetical protein